MREHEDIRRRNAQTTRAKRRFCIGFFFHFVINEEVFLSLFIIAPSRRRKQGARCVTFGCTDRYDRMIFIFSLSSPISSKITFFFFSFGCRGGVAVWGVFCHAEPNENSATYVVGN